MERCVFFELGACYGASLRFLVYENWKYLYYENERNRLHFPESLLSLDVQWDGYFVEPVPKYSDRLMSQEYMQFPNAHFIQGAVHGVSEFRKIVTYTSKIEEWSTPMASVVSDTYGYHDFKQLSEFILKTFTLDELLSYVGVVPTLLRMDVEGSEISILENYSWKHFPRFWQIDIHGHTPEPICSLFEAKGYDVMGTDLGADQNECWFEKKS